MLVLQRVMLIVVVVMSVTLLAGAVPAFAQVRLTFDKHPAVVFADVFTASIRIKSQNDWRDFPSEPGTDEKDVFDPYRERMAVEGKIVGRVLYHVEREFHETSSPWKSVYLDSRILHGLHVRGGQFNMPFGLDQTTSLMNLDFNYHSLAGSYLAPGRSLGMMAYGDFFKKSILAYEAGVFRQDGDNVRSAQLEDVRVAPTFAGRIVVKPFTKLRRLHFARSMETGVAFTDGVLPAGPYNLKGQTVPGDAFLQKVYVNGRRQRLGAQLQWRPGPLGIQAEAMRVRDTRTGQGIEDDDLPPLADRAWYVSGTWLLTGENKKDTITPARPFLNGGYGAIEIGTRVEGLSAGSGPTSNTALYGPRSPGVLPSGDLVWTLGLNWYVNRFFELSLNVIREDRTLPRTATIVPGPVWSRTLRVEFGL
jgi:phosphate-selective porin OprO/OprP